VLSSSEKRYYILQAGRNDVQKEWCSKICVSVAATDQDVVPQSARWWVFDCKVLASVQVNSPGDRLLDIWHKIVNIRVSISDKGKKNWIYEKAIIFLKRGNLLSHNILAYRVKLLDLQNCLYLYRVVLFQKILSKPFAHTDRKVSTKWNKVKRFYSIFMNREHLKVCFIFVRKKCHCNVCKPISQFGPCLWFELLSFFFYENFHLLECNTLHNS
jgi:hypothetical protein